MRLLRRLLRALGALALLAFAITAALWWLIFHDAGGGERADGRPNLWIGTGGTGYAYGATSPAACVPFGLARPGPDTAAWPRSIPFHHFSGYHYADSVIRGFSQTRLSGIGVPDYGNISLLPVPADSGIAESAEEPRVAFSHEDEVVDRPGYYSVVLQPFNYRVELTATTLCAVHRYTPLGRAAGTKERMRVRVDFASATPGAEARVAWEGGLTLDAAGTIAVRGALTGRQGGANLSWVLRVPSAARGNRWIIKEGGGVKCWYVEVPAGESVEVAVGLSWLDVERAMRNLDVQIGSRSFDQIRADAEAQWTALLDRIPVEGGTPAQRTIFSTALVHSFIQPTDITEEGGRYRGIDAKAHDLPHGRRAYTDFSLWDTFRTQAPLITLLDPARSADMMDSLARMGQQGGRLPRWPTAYRYTGCMSGDSAAIALADAWARGVRGFDLEAAYEAGRRGALEKGPGGGVDERCGLEDALKLGYVPADRHEGAASETIEQAQADHALATLAGALGREEDRALFARRAPSWRSLYDPSTGTLHARNADGTFAPPTFEWAWDATYTEGNARQWLWAPALFDLEGLVALAGGREALCARLEAFFEASARETDTFLPDHNYWHGNEPDIHAAYVFALLGRPDLTQKWVRWIMATRYGTGASGLDGNDDCGTLSAWYVWSALGLYPWAGSDRYVLGVPLFREARVRRAEGDIVIRAVEGPASGVTLNGVKLDRWWVRHEEIARGAEIVFTLASPRSP